MTPFLTQSLETPTNNPDIGIGRIRLYSNSYKYVKESKTKDRNNGWREEESREKFGNSKKMSNGIWQKKGTRSECLKKNHWMHLTTDWTQQNIILMDLKTAQ